MIRDRAISRSARYLSFGSMLLLGLVVHAAEIPEDVLKSIRERVDSGKTVGIVVGVVDADGASYFGYGKMAASGDDVPGHDSVFEIGSISKVFTATLLADAVHRGEVNYNDSIQTHLPSDLKVRMKNGKPITLESLSVQNSGLPRMPANFRPKDAMNPFADYTVDNLYTALSRIRLKRSPGEAYEYSNLGVGLLGHLLERASGHSYEELTVSRITNIVGMPDTSITLSKDMETRLAKGHAAGEEVPNWDLPTLAGAGALRSTAQDMIAFLEANLGLRETPLLEIMRETHAPRAEAGSKTTKIGLGWHISVSKDGPDITWHNGGTGGYRTFAGFIQDPPMGVVVLTNSTGAGDDDIGFHVLDKSNPMVGGNDEPGISLDTAILKRYIGKYQLTPQLVFDIDERDGQLRAQLTGQPRVPVFPKSETEFFYKAVDAQLTFELDGDNNVTAVTLHQGGQVIEAKRID